MHQGRKTVETCGVRAEDTRAGLDHMKAHAGADLSELRMQLMGQRLGFHSDVMCIQARNITMGLCQRAPALSLG